MADQNNSKNRYSFRQKVWITGVTLALIFVLLLFFRETAHVFILILVGALVACYFRGLGNFINNKTKISFKWSMTISVLGTILVFAGLFYVMGATVASQTSELTDSFPELLEKGEDFLENTETGKEIVVQFDKLKKSDGLKEFASGFFQST